MGWRKKEKECKESEQKELKTESDKNQCYPMSPNYTPNYPFHSNSYDFTPQQVGVSPRRRTNRKQNVKEDKDSETDYDSDDTVNILRSELI